MAKNYFYNLLLTLANLLFPILSFPYVSRVLGPEGIGKVQFAFSFSQYFAMIAGFGIPIYGMKEIARYKNDYEGRSKIYSELLSIYVLTSTCLSVLYFTTIYIFPYFSIDRDMYLAALLMVLFGCSYIEWVYTGMEEFKSIALRSVLFKVIGLALMFGFVKTTADYKIYLYIMMFSFLGNNILSIVLLRSKVKFMFSELQMQRHIKPLLFIFGTTLVAVIADIDTVLLGFLSNNKAVGLYTAAVKLSKISIPIVTSMGAILIPKTAKYFADGDLDNVQDALNQAFRFIVFFGVPIAFGLALLAPEFIALFSGHQFLEATNSMRLLSLLPLIMGFSHFFLFMILVPSGRNREMFIAEIGGLIVSLVLNFSLIPILRQVGSSIADICSETVVVLIYLYFIKKHFSFTYQWPLLVKAVISSLVFIPLVWLAKGLALAIVYKLIIAVSCCAIAYVGIQLFIFKNSLIFNLKDFIKMKSAKTSA